jgi:hypothetical protein
MGVTVEVTSEDVRRWVERTCTEQGVPVKVEDRAAIGAIVVLLGQNRQSGSTRS